MACANGCFEGLDISGMGERRFYFPDLELLGLASKSELEMIRLHWL